MAAPLPNERHARALHIEEKHLKVLVKHPLAQAQAPGFQLDHYQAPSKVMEVKRDLSDANFPKVTDHLYRLQFGNGTFLTVAVKDENSFHKRAGLAVHMLGLLLLQHRKELH
jgi:hypothetical protein